MEKQMTKKLIILKMNYKIATKNTTAFCTIRNAVNMKYLASSLS